jgi:hypothetical protein
MGSLEILKNTGVLHASECGYILFYWNPRVGPLSYEIKSDSSWSMSNIPVQPLSKGNNWARAELGESVAGAIQASIRSMS